MGLGHIALERGKAGAEIGFQHGNRRAGIGQGTGFNLIHQGLADSRQAVQPQISRHRREGVQFAGGQGVLLPETGELGLTILDKGAMNVGRQIRPDEINEIAKL